MIDREIDASMMKLALQLACRGLGRVEPNPMVGCVIAQDDVEISRGWHQEFGGPHAEVVALDNARADVRGATMFVTLEPCCHQGKTPPCTEAIVRAGIARVVVAQRDSFAKVAGRGIHELRQAGIKVDEGVLQEEAECLNAPYRKLNDSGLPWIIAKWAMALDGKLATRTGESQWISNQSSREITHQLRGRVDAIVVGSNTARIDDPLLTARPAGPRIAARIVVDSQARLPCESKLCSTSSQAPVAIAAASHANERKCRQLKQLGCEVITCTGETHSQRLLSLLEILGQRQMTNILVEGGGQLLGNLMAIRQIDEMHVFIAPKIIGGRDAVTPIGGPGIDRMSEALIIDRPTRHNLGEDTYVRGFVSK